MDVLLIVLAVVGVLALVVLGAGVEQVQQYQRGVVLRFGRLLPEVRQPGLRLLDPVRRPDDQGAGADPRARRARRRAPSPATT